MTFENVLKIKNGKNQRAVENPNGQYPIYGSGGIMGYADDFICRENTVVVGRKGNINKPIFVEKPFWNVDTAFGLEANKELLLPKYLYYFCLRFDFERLNKAVTIPSLTKADLLKIEIDPPPLTKQAEIVNKLDRIDSIKSLREKELATLDDLIKARFVEMFGNADRYSMEPLVENVHEMFIGPFGSALKNECFVEPEDGYCIVYEQKHAIQKTMDVPTRYVDEEKYQELKRFSVFPGDIIVSCRGTIGEIFIVPKGAPLGIMHPSIMKIRLDTEKYDQKFFVLALEKYMNEHNNEAKGSGVKMAVTATTLGKELFVVPPMDVQRQFSAFVEQIDKSKSAIQASLNETQTLFDSLMQQYFG